MIELRNVSKTFATVSGSVEAVRNVSLTINDGDIFGVIGLSGAGKSTLVRCINFLERPTEGSVLFSGVDLASLNKKQLLETRRKIAMIFQNFNLLAQRSALANVCYPMEITGVPKKKAIEKAKKTGVGIVTVRESNHFGIAGYYAKMACDEGLLGMACTNSEAIMVPTFGKKAMLGSNPIAVAMPADPYPFFFDCSTTVVTRGKLEMYNKMEKPLPNGWALDKDGHASTDAPDVLANIVAKKGGGIMPLGGNEEVTGSHKGYGYGMLCELFSSILSMGVTSDHCCTFPDKTGICHGFMAIDPAAFGDPQAIRRHFSEYLEALRESPKAEGKERIYTHGEKEVFAEKERREHGIPVNDNTMVELANLCGYLKLDFDKYFDGYELPKDSKFFTGNY